MMETCFLGEFNQIEEGGRPHVSETYRVFLVPDEMGGKTMARIFIDTYIIPCIRRRDMELSIYTPFFRLIASFPLSV
jgi:hypothetical protein